MKRFAHLALLVALIVVLCVPCAQAATVMERLEALEAVLGISAPGETIDLRIAYLEEQLGIAKQDGLTLDARMTALETVLGLPTTPQAGAVLWTTMKAFTPLPC